MTRTLTISLTAIAFATLALTGCGSGQERSTATSKASAAVPADATKATQELDQVLSALKGIQSADDNADLKKLYSDLKSQTSQLEGSLADVASSGDSAVVAGKKQISRWHEQADSFTDADLRAASNKREADLRQSVDALSASNATLKSTSDAYRSQLSQTIKALDLDLSRPGVKSVQPIIAKLVDGEAALRGSITDVSDKSRDVHSVLNQ